MLEIKFNRNYFFCKPSTTEFAKHIRAIAGKRSSEIRIELLWDYTIAPQYAVLVAALNYIGVMGGNNVSYNINPAAPKIMRFLMNTGITKKFKGSIWSKFTAVLAKNNRNIDFNVSRNRDEAENQINDLLEKLPIITSDLARQALFSIYYELFDNAFTHAKSTVGVFTCGTSTPEEDFLFSIYDIGVGIPPIVREYLKRSEMTDCEALEWALKEGNSTLQTVGGIPRGLGLSRLVTLTRANCGEMIVVTGSAYCRIDKDQVQFSSMNEPLLGTLFMFKVVHDDLRRYVLREEYNDKNKCC